MLIEYDEIPTNVWFTSDHHFGHANIIKFCNRPFDDADSMDRHLVKCWNNVVKEDDIVYHLGDLMLSDDMTVFNNYYLANLNGQLKILCNPWHHDKRWMAKFIDHMARGMDFVKYVELITPMVVLEIPQQNRRYPLAITLCHYPLGEWDRKHYGGICLHGHSHGNYKPCDASDLILDVGVDSAAKLMGEYRPFSLAEVFECLKAGNDD